MLTENTITKLQEMRLSAMAAAFKEQLTNPNIAELSFEDRFGLLVDKEWLTRKNNHLARLIKNSSRQGDIVLDTFGGSGSTLITCEQLGRSCYTMELDPKYADVIVKRWLKFTGAGQAELVRSGKKIRVQATDLDVK